MAIDTTLHADLIRALTSGLGEGSVLTQAEDIGGHLVEARGLYRGEALAVVRPRDRDEVAFAVQECARAGVSIAGKSKRPGNPLS